MNLAITVRVGSLLVAAALVACAAPTHPPARRADPGDRRPVTRKQWRHDFGNRTYRLRRGLWNARGTLRKGRGRFTLCHDDGSCRRVEASLASVRYFDLTADGHTDAIVRLRMKPAKTGSWLAVFRLSDAGKVVQVAALPLFSGNTYRLLLGVIHIRSPYDTPGCETRYPIDPNGPGPGRRFCKRR